MTESQAETLRQGDVVKYLVYSCNANAYCIGSKGRFVGLKKNCMGATLLLIKLERKEYLPDRPAVFYPNECELVEKAKESPLQL